ncbi:hypothetical protein PLICRDRAFT_170141 [Plicaturopsis crispa FD-325 SS-3]|nr:hypothetical protein PLICRDRAFT_170141 [Plicaturopsis crispa FD-325 SS-3]
MSHTSPASYIVWAILSTLLGSFLVFHLWSFDRFKCLKWNNGPYSGAFKRIMTYSYLISVPSIMGYSIGFSVIKYREGYTFIPGHGIVPTPYELWTDSERSVIFPMYMLFSIGWSLEMVTHLEELCFWLFLVNAGTAQQDWFRSLYFKTWIIGSGVAICYMPLVTIFTRNDLLKCEAYTFLAGALGSLSLTLWFLPILWTFPTFLRNLRRENVDTNTVVRLTKFHELNLNVGPTDIAHHLSTDDDPSPVCLGIDGVRPHQHVNESIFWTDLLAMLAGFGCVISSGITLVIFFPRSIESEIAAKELTREKRLGTNSRLQPSMLQSQNSAQIQTMQSGTAAPLSPNLSKSWANKWEDEQESRTWETDEERDLVPPPMPPRYTTAYYAKKSSPSTGQILNPTDADEDDSPRSNLPLRPNRRGNESGTIEMGGIGGLTAGNLSKHNQRMSKVNHLVHNFTSPIDLASGPHSEAVPREPRFTFTPRR